MRLALAQSEGIKYAQEREVGTRKRLHTVH